jgi:hypothetical protein
VSGFISTPPTSSCCGASVTVKQTIHSHDRCRSSHHRLQQACSVLGEVAEMFTFAKATIVQGLKTARRPQREGNCALSLSSDVENA